MELFNPWLGFPARNSIYLDQNFVRLRGNGQAAYGTTQSAYDAATALRASSGAAVMIMVGQGAFGNLTLTADYDSDVVWFGIHKDVSSIGIIDARANPSYTIDLQFSNLTIGNILGGATGADTSNNITLNGNGLQNCTVGNISNNPSGASNTGSISVSDLTCGTVQCVVSTGNANTGSITVNRCITGAITTSPDNEFAGAVTVEDSETGAINFTMIGGSGAIVDSFIQRSVCGNIVFTGSFTGNLELRDSSFGRINNASFIGGILKANNCIIESASSASVSLLENGCILNGCTLVATGGNNDCVEDLNGSTTVIISNSVLIPAGTGVPVDAGSASTVILRNVTSNKDVGANVTVDGDFFIIPTMISPL